MANFLKLTSLKDGGPLLVNLRNTEDIIPNKENGKVEGSKIFFLSGNAPSIVSESVEQIWELINQVKP